MSERYLEDYAVGQKFGSGRIRVDKDRIKAFATEFDPQPFHLDETLASDTIFRGLAASGWHTAAMTMRWTWIVIGLLFSAVTVALYGPFVWEHWVV